LPSLSIRAVVGLFGLRAALRELAAEYGCPWELVDEAEYAGRVSYARVGATKPP